MKGIVCMTPNKGIGYANQIPWKSKKDMAFFKKTTTGKGNNAIVMGYNTYRSLGFRALPNRRNYIVTNTPQQKAQYHGSDVVFESNIHNILLLDFIFDEVYIIGGQSIYELFEPYMREIYVNVIHCECIANVFFPIVLDTSIKDEIKYEKDENGCLIEFTVYRKSDPEDVL